MLNPFLVSTIRLMLGRAKKYIFLLIVFFISSQVGLHFWPSFAYVNGIRVDYLSPTLYLLDILIGIWIAVCLLARNKKEKIAFDKATQVLILLLLFDLVWNLFFSMAIISHLWGIIKLEEMAIFAILVAREFRKEWIQDLVRTISASALLSSILGMWQFINQSSVGGIWYYFGERLFSLTTVGISTVNLDQQILRSYGAFPHPNILAFFLAINIIFSYYNLRDEKKIWRAFLIGSILLSIVALFTTFSRTVIAFLICFSIYEIYTKLKQKYRIFTLGFLQVVIPFFVVFSILNFKEFILRGIDFRQELFIQSWEIFQKNPYFGIGLNNFFVWQEPLIKTISPTNFQPPHNMYVGALLSLGLFGWWIFPYGFYKGIVRVMKNLRVIKGEAKDFNKGVLVVLVGIIIVGMFDHFFLTLEQGQVMLALILGLSYSHFFSKIPSNERNVKRIRAKRLSNKEAS